MSLSQIAGIVVVVTHSPWLLVGFQKATSHEDLKYDYRPILDFQLFYWAYTFRVSECYCTCILIVWWMILPKRCHIIPWSRNRKTCRGNLLISLHGHVAVTYIPFIGGRLCKCRKTYLKLPSDAQFWRQQKRKCIRKCSHRCQGLSTVVSQWDTAAGVGTPPPRRNTSGLYPTVAIDDNL